MLDYPASDLCGSVRSSIISCFLSEHIWDSCSHLAIAMQCSILLNWCFITTGVGELHLALQEHCPCPLIGNCACPSIKAKLLTPTDDYCLLGLGQLACFTTLTSFIWFAEPYVPVQPSISSSSPPPTIFHLNCNCNASSFYKRQPFWLKDLLSCLYSTRRILKLAQRQRIYKTAIFLDGDWRISVGLQLEIEESVSINKI